MDTPLSILYTHNLRGSLDLLPRLYTLIKLLRAQAQLVEDEDEVMLCMFQPATRRVVLLDMGDSCSPDAWHCAATGGRSTLIVLDAMGYDAAYVTGQLASDAREKLAESTTIALVDGEHTWRDNGLIVTAARQPDTAFQVVMQPGASARLDGKSFYPAALQAGQVGMAHIGFGAGLADLVAHEIHSLSASTPPDPTIAGTVDFVLGEARLFQKKQAR
jgi:hypothetical protein